MQIKEEYPPNYDEILKVLEPEDAIFCYGDVIYNPYKLSFDKSYEVHEEVHSLSQGGDPSGWWDRYLKDPKFRLEEELVAHKTQYDFLKGKDREKNNKVVHQFALFLSSKMYGNLISYNDARKYLQSGEQSRIQG